MIYWDVHLEKWVCKSFGAFQWVKSVLVNANLQMIYYTINSRQGTLKIITPYISMISSTWQEDLIPRSRSWHHTMPGGSSTRSLGV